MTIAIERRPVPAYAAALAAAGVEPVLARLFASRGIAAPEEIDDALARLPAYASMRGIGEAAERLVRAIDRRERILVVADYDADGATACAVALRGLRAMGAVADFLVPNRFNDGYGLTPGIVAQVRERSPALLVTVDNGITSVEGVAAAATAGIDVLVTDHHLPGERLPEPAIIVNPNQPGCAFPSKHLAGVGVMFYVLAATRALLRERGGNASANLADLLDLVALGTVADVVRLDHANRVLVAQGLKRLRAGRAQAGVEALFRVAGRDPRSAIATDLGFVAGPRLNAAGRLADMTVGIRCLVTDDPAEALALAAELDRLNRERRSVEAGIVVEAQADLDEAATMARDDTFTLCLYRPNWHQGVVGIVASRIKDREHRPAIVFAPAGDGRLRGSGRSIAGFHLRDALALVDAREPGLIGPFGGHAVAAGLAIREADFGRFAEAFERVGREWLRPADLERVIETDGALAPGELDVSLAERLREPVWGQGFAPPAFDDEFGVAASRIVGGAHTKLLLERGGERFDAILFRSTAPLPGRIRAVFRPEVDTFRGSPALQLVLTHWEPAGSA
ncbi:MAG: single-stranded-DNA-specific exonuclease RecJ [Betaproteobacteria bacterium]|nr:single-stranded-DNA-specific exonuclease RecJ [Betaproteobacteria bacterium]MDH5285568.1 single-stranded-DNA-specific exonuclease RecJ [Betaproteobacteria bacterium]